MKNILKRISSPIVVLGLQLIASICLFVFCIQLDVLPNKYLIMLAIGLILLLVGLFFVMKPGKKGPSIREPIAKIVSIILSIVLLIGSSYVAKSSQTLDKITTEKKTSELRYCLYVMKKSKFTDLDKLNNTKKLAVNTAMDQDNLTPVTVALLDKIGFKQKEYTDFQAMVADLYSGEIDAMLMNESYTNIFEEDYPKFSKETKILWTYSLEKQNNNTSNNKKVTTEPFCFLISGVDTRGKVDEQSRSDVILLVTVNQKHKQILLTSIPRDYFVPLANCGVPDKITHSGMFGTKNVEKTVENLLGIDIDYNARVNFTFLKKLVNAIGGIDVYSDKEFVPVGNKKIVIPKGLVHMNGKMALAFARERKTYTSGDRHRNQNQQQVLQAIFNKLMSPAILTSYAGILKAVEGTFTTNMKTSDIKALAKYQLEESPKWTFQNTVLSGYSARRTGGYMAPSMSLYYMIPYQSSVDINSKYINNMLKGKKIKVTTDATWTKSELEDLEKKKQTESVTNPNRKTEKATRIN